MDNCPKDPTWPSALLAALLDDGTLGQKHDLQGPFGGNPSKAMAALEGNPLQRDMQSETFG